MGAYNTVKISGQCSRCGAVVERCVQFKYGEVWQHVYAIGDHLLWGSANVGDPKHKSVVVDGAGENCPNCQGQGDDYEVWIQDGKIVEVRLAAGNFDFVKNHGNYIVIE